MIVDELGHIIRQIAAQATIETRPWVYAHVSDYNPANNSVRVIVPSMRDDQTDAPLHSGWLPLGTQQAGSQTGLQVVPYGGASSDNPTAGELCMVALNDRGTGVAAVVCMLYTDQQRPPHNALSPGLQPGEVVLRHASGSFVRLHTNGDVEVTTGQDGAVNATTSGAGGITLKTTGNGGIALTTTGPSATIMLTSAQPVVINADLHITGRVLGGFSGADQIDLMAHVHTQPPDSRGDTEANTSPPVAGT